MKGLFLPLLLDNSHQFRNSDHVDSTSYIIRQAKECCFGFHLGFPFQKEKIGVKAALDRSKGVFREAFTLFEFLHIQMESITYLPFQYFYPPMPVRRRIPVAGAIILGRCGSHYQDILVKIGLLKISPGIFADTTLTSEFVAIPYSSVFLQGLLPHIIYTILYKSDYQKESPPITNSR